MKPMGPNKSLIDRGSHPADNTLVEAHNPFCVPTRTVLIEVKVPIDMQKKGGCANPFLVSTCANLASDAMIEHLGGLPPPQEVPQN
jgi:hypothetical protein